MAAYIYITMSESSASTVNNTSVVSVNVYYVGNGKSWSNNYCPGTIYIGGQGFSFSHQFTRSTSAQWIGGASATITHNSSGGGSVSASASFTTGVSIGTLTASNSMTLQNIPRASTASVSNSHPHYGDTVSINISPQISGAVHELYVGADNHLSWTKIADGISTKYDWVVPYNIAEYYRDTDNALWLSVETYHNGTFIGSRQYKPAFYLEPTDTMKPTLQLVVSDPSGLANRFGAYVRGQSQIKVNLTESYKYGATASRRNILINGSTYLTESVTVDITPSFDRLIKATVIDSRGVSADNQITIATLDWAAPKVKLFQIERCTASGIPQDGGDYVKATYAVEVAPVGNKNERSCSLLYRTQGSPSWRTKSVPLNSYDSTGSTVVAATSDNSFDFKLIVTDSFVETSSAVEQIGSGFALMDWHHSGTGMAIGKIAEHPNLLEINVPVKFNKGASGTAEIRVYENVIVTSTGAVSDSTYSGYRYRLDVPLQGCTPVHIADVYPALDNAGMFCAACETRQGALRLWVKNNTFGIMTIPSIKLSKGV